MLTLKTSTIFTSVSTSTATTEEVATVRYTNAKEAVKCEKYLRKANENAVKRLQKGENGPSEMDLDDVMRELVAHFKTKMSVPFEPAAKASRKSVINSITNKMGCCIWDTLKDPDEDDDDDDDITVQIEENAPKFVSCVKFIIPSMRITQ